MLSRKASGSGNILKEIINIKRTDWEGGMAGITTMDKFVDFMSYAGTLYDKDETTQYMIDVLAVIHGHLYTRGDEFLSA